MDNKGKFFKIKNILLDSLAVWIIVLPLRHQ